MEASYFCRGVNLGLEYPQHKAVHLPQGQWICETVTL